VSVVYNIDGSAQFVCERCGVTVFTFDRQAVDFCVCKICQFIDNNPQIPEETRKILRGER
jgi:hypothetical protein